MTDELRDKAEALAKSYLATLHGKARAFYETRADVKALMERTARNVAELSLELIQTTDPDRRASILESIETGGETIANEVAALAQDVSTEARSAIADALKMIVGFAKDTLPILLGILRRDG